MFIVKFKENLFWKIMFSLAITYWSRTLITPGYWLRRNPPPTELPMLLPPMVYLLESTITVNFSFVVNMCVCGYLGLHALFIMGCSSRILFHKTHLLPYPFIALTMKHPFPTLFPLLTYPIYFLEWYGIFPNVYLFPNGYPINAHPCSIWFPYV